MNQFTKQHLVHAIQLTHQTMQESRDYLIKLDSDLGDGDLGLTMSKGFAAASNTASSLDDTDLGNVFKKVGFAISKEVPSTMGTLMATAFLGAGKAITGRETLNAQDVALCFRSMAEAVSARGKAKEGEKTMLDVLFPVARAMEGFDGTDITELMKVALKAANNSLEKTKEMMNQHGKAAVFREKSIGLLDPGAAATTLMIRAFAKACDA